MKSINELSNIASESRLDRVDVLNTLFDKQDTSAVALRERCIEMSDKLKDVFTKTLCPIKAEAISLDMSLKSTSVDIADVEKRTEQLLENISQQSSKLFCILEDLLKASANKYLLDLEADMEPDAVKNIFLASLEEMKSNLGHTREIADLSDLLLNLETGFRKYYSEKFGFSAGSRHAIAGHLESASSVLKMFHNFTKSFSDDVIGKEIKVIKKPESLKNSHRRLMRKAADFKDAKEHMSQLLFQFTYQIEVGIKQYQHTAKELHDTLLNGMKMERDKSKSAFDKLSNAIEASKPSSKGSTTSLKRKRTEDSEISSKRSKDAS